MLLEGLHRRLQLSERGGTQNVANGRADENLRIALRARLGVGGGASHFPNSALLGDAHAHVEKLALPSKLDDLHQDSATIKLVVAHPAASVVGDDLEDGVGRIIDEF